MSQAEREQGAGKVHGIYCPSTTAVLLGVEVLIIIFYASFTKYGDVASTGTGAASDTSVNEHYGQFQDVHVMIFIGFGFLMTFLKKYGFGSVGFNFLISAFIIQVSILTNGFWHNALASGGPSWHKIQIDILTLITADFAAGAAMITFGAILGKASPIELCVITTIEMVFYGLNESIGALQLEAVDMGGSIFVHTFGAYFGLAVSWVITPKEKFEEDDEGSTYHSDMFAMIGTIFLWMFWPSFNGALATGTQQHRVIINTVLALTASCVVAFVMSSLLRDDSKFDMVDIQNATLAGGVAVGSSSDLTIDPYAALIVGCVAAVISVAGYTILQPWLVKKRWLHDTCGVHNLHGMPGILGGVGGAIAALLAGDKVYGEDISTIYAARDRRTAGEQCGYQLATLTITLGISIASGIIAGYVVILMRNCCDPGPHNYFHDADYWEGVEDLEGAPSSLKVEEVPLMACEAKHDQEEEDTDKEKVAENPLNSRNGVEVNLETSPGPPVGIVTKGDANGFEQLPASPPVSPPPKNVDPGLKAKEEANQNGEVPLP